MQWAIDTFRVVSYGKHGFVYYIELIGSDYVLDVVHDEKVLMTHKTNTIAEARKLAEEDKEWRTHMWETL